MADDAATVMITGAAGHLGRAVARAFEARGARLVLVDAARERLEPAYGGGDAHRMVAAVDLLDAQATRRCAEDAIARFGRIDALCNIAGGFRMGPRVDETPDATLDALFDLNVRTLVHASAAVVPHMLARGRGKIVNVGAFAAQKGLARMGAYCAAKSAVIRLTESMAAELREHGVNVNCVLPTVLDTPDNRAAMPDADPSRWVALDDLASVVAFLASDAARAVHGAAVPVTGLS
jgi:NAD(P)-dependent dehydrogenase (short-subunit alcohol dehydrogenase family)